MKEYWENLVKQMREVGIEDGDSVNIQATDGLPAVVTVQSGTVLRVFIQNEDLTKLECKLKLDL